MTGIDEVEAFVLKAGVLNPRGNKVNLWRVSIFADDALVRLQSGDAGIQGKTRQGLAESAAVGAHQDTIRAGEWHDFVAIDSRGTFVATLTMDGDADLYVKEGGRPNSNDYDCRPYLSDDSTESCELQGPGRFYVSVNGYDPVVNYELRVEYHP